MTTVTPLITTLFLDIGGVLLTNGWDRAARRQAAAAFDLDYDDLNERHHLTFDTYETGKLGLDVYLDRVVFYRERSFTQAAFKQYMFEQSKPFPRMIELVRTLKSHYGLKVATVSNEGQELTVYRIDTFELDTFVDFFVSSCFVHLRKPDEDIYRTALNVAHVTPSEVVYIDDRPMFIQVAGGMGIHGIVHTDYQSTRDELARLGLSLAPA